MEQNNEHTRILCEIQFRSFKTKKQGQASLFTNIIY